MTTTTKNTTVRRGEPVNRERRPMEERFDKAQIEEQEKLQGEGLVTRVRDTTEEERPKTLFQRALEADENRKNETAKREKSAQTPEQKARQQSPENKGR